MFNLPTSNDPRRELFDLDVIAKIGASRGAGAPTLREAIAAGRRSVADKTTRAAHVVALLAGGDLVLIRVGKRGAWRKVWTFGQV